MKDNISCVDLFCGAGGLTHGFLLEGLPVKAGVDFDPACRYPYTVNNDGVEFICGDISKMSAQRIARLFMPNTIRVLAGCPPCQPFSVANRKRHRSDSRADLITQFKRMVKEILPDIVVMENVSGAKRSSVFTDFVIALNRLSYNVWYRVVVSADYGVPQTRKRLILLASLHGPITMIAGSNRHKTVRETIGKLKPLKAGESDPKDKLHVAARLSDKNMARIRASKPGGTWKDWPPRLQLRCHLAKNNTINYSGVYARMEWDKPAPTIMTRCFDFGNARFGHPEQDRAISLREAALLQGFSEKYKFVEPGEKVRFRTVGRLIGNSVPVGLSRAIAKSVIHSIGD